jgi:transcriptional regulator GlxA family with amidase domain
MITKIAFFAFPRLTLLDLVGAYDGLRRVAALGIDPSVTHRIIGTEATIVDDTGVRLLADGVYEDLSPYHLLVVPGGLGTRELVDDARAIDYLRGWGTERPIASVCSGSLLLGAAGHLRGKRATTHHLVYDALRPFCAHVEEGRRIVDEGRVVTAAGVSSSLDLGLYLVERFWGPDARGRIATQMEYRAYDA